MLEKRSARYTEELRDPLLSALLHEALDDDPALLEAPGRSERIMRKVLAAGVRPAPRRAWWTPWVMASGGLATAAAAVYLLVGTVHLPGGMPVANMSQSPMTAVVPHSAPTPPVDVATNDNTNVAPKAPQIVEKKMADWKSSTAGGNTTSSSHHQVIRPTEVADKKGEGSTKEPAVTVASVDKHAAAALYDAGTVAHAVGDYETAYNAYQASYDLEPTPDALLASGTALEQMAKDVLDTDGSST